MNINSSTDDLFYRFIIASTEGEKKYKPFVIDLMNFEEKILLNQTLNLSDKEDKDFIVKIDILITKVTEDYVLRIKEKNNTGKSPDSSFLFLDHNHKEHKSDKEASNNNSPDIFEGHLKNHIEEEKDRDNIMSSEFSLINLIHTNPHLHKMNSDNDSIRASIRSFNSNKQNYNDAVDSDDDVINKVESKHNSNILL